jgi:hypothetical protein
MIQNTRIQFLRDSQLHPVGCLAINLDLRNHRLTYQMSVLNPVDRFDRKVARQLALGRLVEAPIAVTLPRGRELSMHDITEAVMRDVIRSKAPGRARRAARNWMVNWIGD